MAYPPHTGSQVRRSKPVWDDFRTPIQLRSRQDNQGLLFRESPLNELARSKPSDVMSRYSTSAKNFGSTHVAFGFLMVLVSLDFGLTTASSCFLIWLETVRDQPVPTLPM
jgi:hypothetical protein